MNTSKVWSVYSATEAVVAAFSEVIALDVQEFDIKVIVAEPSGFRTGFLTKNSLTLIPTKIEGYVLKNWPTCLKNWNNGNQPLLGLILSSDHYS